MLRGPDYFNGNMDLARMYESLRVMLHTCDDLVDHDKELSAEDITTAFRIALVDLPANPVYRMIQAEVLPFWIMVIQAFTVANRYERERDPVGLEVGHTLRYAAGHIMGYAVTAVFGPTKAAEIMGDIWKLIVAERFDDYRKEHLNAE